ncbi:MAG: hypothetical protein K0B15_17075 [Lentimicrobium sp.]|nr:hypothetical protein [Lentimicrobium sp.]
MPERRPVFVGKRPIKRLNGIADLFLMALFAQYNQLAPWLDDGLFIG